MYTYRLYNLYLHSRPEGLQVLKETLIKSFLDTLSDVFSSAGNDAHGLISGFYTKCHLNHGEEIGTKNETVEKSFAYIVFVPRGSRY